MNELSEKQFYIEYGRMSGQLAILERLVAAKDIFLDKAVIAAVIGAEVDDNGTD